MNTYKKFCANVFVAKCTEEHQKGDVITVETKYGKENEHIVFNLVKKDSEFYYYSIVRADGLNAQEYAKNRANKLIGYANKREQKSNDYIEASKEGREFLIMGEPIHVGHASERGHRALLERNDNRMRKAHEENEKAEKYKYRAEYWINQTDVINLSMPESLEYYKFKFEEATKYHADMKDGKIEKTHDYSLTYAKKKSNELKKKYNLAIKLWG